MSDFLQASEFLFWKQNKETKKILTKVQKELDDVMESLNNGSLLINQDNDLLIRAYTRKIGYKEGLQFIEKVFNDSTRTDEDGTDEDRD